MPKEMKKRGRREAKRQKLSHDADNREPSNTTGQTQGLTFSAQAFVASEANDTGAMQMPFESSIAPGTTFYGLLDEQEQEYFRKADETLEANQFKSDEAAASVAATEYLQPNNSEPDDKDEAYISTENLFLYMITELDPSIDSLLMNPFGAHVLRTLFLVLSGAPLDSPSHKSLVHSKKKEKVSLAVDKTESTRTEARQVPESFREALSKIINKITADINRESIRNLATDPLGSPTLQLLIELDLGRSRKYKTKIEESLAGKLLLQIPGEEERDTEATKSFVKMLLSDTVGSHLLERVVTCVPKKTFNQLYGQHFKDQIGSLAASETSSFVVVKVLEKLEAQDFKSAEEDLRKDLPLLLENRRVAVIRSVIENCSKQGISASGFCDTLFRTWSSNRDGEQNLLLRMLEIQSEELEDLDAVAPKEKEKGKRKPSQLHASLLVQALLTVPGECSVRVRNW
ncbi:hypothetical protein ABW20_dc0107960 [Dactylellina cionopaga]|nr:hypothetical protein ABW20_dc0107960 [Dactylellina cionopaga]